MADTPNKIFDFPVSELQLHVHTDGTGTTIIAGSLITYDRKERLLLDGYKLAMADLLATQLEWPDKAPK